jgi:hypothetical protein
VQQVETLAELDLEQALGISVAGELVALVVAVETLEAWVGLDLSPDGWPAALASPLGSEPPMRPIARTSVRLTTWGVGPAAEVQRWCASHAPNCSGDRMPWSRTAV